MVGFSQKQEQEEQEEVAQSMEEMRVFMAQSHLKEMEDSVIIIGTKAMLSELVSRVKARPEEWQADFIAKSLDIYSSIIKDVGGGNAETE